MCNDIISHVPFHRIVGNGQSAQTHAATAIWRKRLLLRIGCQIPLQNRFCPVSAGTDDQVLDMPLQVIPKISFGRCPLLGKVNVFFRVGFFYLGHGFDFAQIQVESRTVYIRIGILVIKHRDGIFRMIAVMVINDNFSFNPCSLECGTQMGFDEFCLFFSFHKHTGVVSGMLRFILYGDGIDRNALLCHRLYVLDKVIGIAFVIFRFQFPPDRTVVGLHPRGRAPGAAHNFEFRVDVQYLLKHWDKIQGVICQTKACQFRIGFSLFHVSIRKHQLIQIGRPNTDPKEVDADGIFFPGK